MIMIINDGTQQVAKGRSYRIRLKEGSLITISSSLHSIDTSFGRLLGHSGELHGVKSDRLPAVSCVIYVEQHLNGLCVLHYPMMGLVWSMPSAIHESKVVG